jgi:predicted Zn-dependent protease
MASSLFAAQIIEALAAGKPGVDRAIRAWRLLSQMSD